MTMFLLKVHMNSHETSKSYPGPIVYKKKCLKKNYTKSKNKKKNKRALLAWG